MNVRVDVERVGSGAMEGSRDRSDEIGYSPYAEVVVRTIRTDRRGFVRARNAANLRRIEVVGREEEKWESCAEASGAISESDVAGVPEAAFAASSSFKRFLLLCGNSRC